MGIIIISFLIGIIIGACIYHKHHDSEEFVFIVLLGCLLALVCSICAAILTSTNCDEYYTFVPTEIELSTIDGKSIALDGAKIYYIEDNEIHSVKASRAHIKNSDTPRAIYYKYCGFNEENRIRWLYTFPNGGDYVEFYIPDGSISTTYHFKGN